MRLGLRISALLISCSILINQGCTSERSADDQARSDAKDESKDGVAGDKKDEVPVVVPIVPAVGPVVVPVDPFTPPPPPGGGGGGSQGAIKPARTGNPDASGHGPRCGNDIQEARGQVPNCKYNIYGTSYTSLQGPSSLLGFNLNDGGVASFNQVITPVGLGCTIQDVTALEFSPDGTLYAVGSVSCDGPSTYRLLTLDCQTAKATIIGKTDIESLFTDDAPHISDLDFDSHGKLYAYVRAVGSDEADQLGFINIATGKYTTIGNTGLDEIGNGLASLEFPDPSELFQAGTSLNQLSTNTGAAFNPQPLTFPADISPTDNPRVRAMDRDPLGGIIYVNLQYGPVFNPTASFLAILNPNDTVTYLTSSPQQAPMDLRGITVNRTYEECDGTDFELPSGTVCSSDCLLLETNCADFVVVDDDLSPVDNDFDGLANCLDSDCEAQTCNDHDGCFVDEVCAGTKCIGTPNTACVDGNECTLNICNDNREDLLDAFTCDNTLDETKTELGDCTALGNCSALNDDGTCPVESVEDVCILGRCASRAAAQCEINADCGANGSCDTVTKTCGCESNDNCPTGTTCDSNTCVYDAPTCEGVDRAVVPFAEGGCDDSNQLTVDICDNISPTEYDCDNGIGPVPMIPLNDAVRPACEADMSCAVDAPEGSR